MGTLFFFAVWGIGGAVSPPGVQGDALVWGKTPIFFVCVCVCIRHAKMVIFKANIG